MVKHVAPSLYIYHTSMRGCVGDRARQWAIYSLVGVPAIPIIILQIGLNLAWYL